MEKRWLKDDRDDGLSILILNLPKRVADTEAYRKAVRLVYLVYPRYLYVLCINYKYIYLIYRVNVEPHMYVHTQNNVINMLPNIYLEVSG